ncbi:hypothetical protein ADICYQ_0919 [Cyclobacterium qasimii M12-11B]|uniref:Uncharacterized protein n=1 Tax=Cyclobacterium qasimii M12-11B TaxID=641524 RepID=S7VJV4_9BACT|nr:hypothetical protein ADICYQ_0919 [Cyclobacterium qasimii M12-11B]
MVLRQRIGYIYRMNWERFQQIMGRLLPIVFWESYGSIPNHD